MANKKMNVDKKNYSDIPVWRRYTLTIEEATGYYHIGEGKLRMLIDTRALCDYSHNVSYVLSFWKGLEMLIIKQIQDLLLNLVT